MTSKSLKTSPEQYEMMVACIEKHPNLNNNRVGKNFTRKDRNRLWEDLSKSLNSVRGAKKDVPRWLKTWIDFKHITLKTARMLRRKQLESTGTFSLELLQKEMNPLQCRVLSLCGWNEDSGGHIEEKRRKKEERESPQSPPSFNEPLYPIVEVNGARAENGATAEIVATAENGAMAENGATAENGAMAENGAISENDELMEDDVVVDDDDDDDDDVEAIELFSITKYPDNEYHKQKKERSAISLLLQQQTEILGKISKQHKRILETELKENSKKEFNSKSVTVLLQQQNRLLSKVSQQLERLANAKQLRKDANSKSINLLLEQQNLLLEKIAMQQERIANADKIKADTLPGLANAIKELLKHSH